MNIEHPSLLFRIAKRFRTDMNPNELYEATRGVWVLGPRREEARYATPYETRRVAEEADLTNRWEFEGEVADIGVRERYRGMDVSTMFARGAANPATYAGLES